MTRTTTAMTRTTGTTGATLAAAAAALLLTSCGASTSTTAATATPAPVTVTGTIHVSKAIAPAPDDLPTDELGEYPDAVPGDTCITQGGYTDIAAGTAVRLATDTGATIALGQLDAGTIPAGAYTAGRFGPCEFPFRLTATDLGDGQFFSVEVGRRGAVRYSREQLQTPLELTLS